jgi:hypothetical protein
MPGSESVGSPGFESADSYKAFAKSKYLSVKHVKYFHVYDELFQNYRNRDIVFVEIGVLNGGSLFMWRDYFGPGARIIGIDFNPEAKKWESEGFEIFIGDQSSPDFWQQFFSVVGEVDVILDDGGHTNEQQIITTHCCLENIKKGGKLVVEDTHTSYLSEFGNPSPFSFINYSKKLIDSLNARFPGVRVSSNLTNRCVYSIGFYESFVAFSIDRDRCLENAPINNNGMKSNAADFRHQGTNVRGQLKVVNSMSRRFNYLKKVRLIVYLKDLVVRRWLRFVLRKRNRVAKRYFNL